MRTDQVATSAGTLPSGTLTDLEIARSVTPRPIVEVARELGCGESSLGGWLAKDRAERAAADPERYAAEVAESVEVKRLRRRVAELEVEREILKRSMVFWVKESNA